MQFVAELVGGEPVLEVLIWRAVAAGLGGSLDAAKEREVFE